MAGYLGAYAQRTKHLFDYNVIQPNLEVIDGRSYRVNPVWPTTYEKPEKSSTKHDYDSSCPGAGQPYYEEEDDDLTDEDLDITLGKDGQYRLNCHIPKSFYPFLIGTKGSTKRRIETETNTKLDIPRQGQSGDVIISGYNQKSVVSAKNRLNILLVFARKKIPYTHLLSIPMNVPNIQENFLKFKSIIMQDYSHCRGVEESLFPEPGRLHITMGMLVLADSTERDYAVEMLQKCAEEIILPILRSQRIVVSLRGLDYMNDDPAEVDVLFAKVIDNDNLVQKLCDDVIQYFIKHNLVDKSYQKYDSVKMHVTVMNTNYRAKHNTDIQNAKRETFNASEILDSLRDFDFGDTFVYCVHLSQRHTSDINGYFKSSAVISL